MCRLLNLRESLITDFEVHNLLSLEFIDIKGSKILNIDLTGCIQLKKVVADLHQNVLTNAGV